jgi:hypothetical protein
MIPPSSVTAKAGLEVKGESYASTATSTGLRIPDALGLQPGMPNGGTNHQPSGFLRIQYFVLLERPVELEAAVRA